MILRNWMRKDPATITSDTLVSEAVKLVAEKNLKALPVLDEGCLRGLVTRKELQGCATAVARAQDEHETEYFLGRLKVKDIMIRMPQTMEAEDTVEHCMLKGQQELISSFPVMEQDKLVGLVSSYELFDALSQVLGAEEIWCGITLEPTLIEKGTIGKVTKIVDEAGATLFGVFTMRLPDSPNKRIILRLETDDLQRVKEALGAGGFAIAEISRQVQAGAQENGEA